MNKLILDYFSTLYDSNGRMDNDLIQDFRLKVTDDQNAFLVGPFVEADVKDLLFSMHPDKAPGLDGLNPAFFQKHWDIVKADIVEICLTTIQTGCLPQHLHETAIVLIPKKKVP